MRLPSPRELKSFFPLLPRQEWFIAESRRRVQEILTGKDPRIAIVVGPCSIHDRGAALAYGENLKKLAEKVEKSCYIVMRVYIEKPRTTTGWKGYLYDPHLDESYDILTGLKKTRELLLELAALEVPAAAEFVNPLAASYFSDLVSWGFIGARTSASQPHRQLASHLPFPVGFKNGTDGNLEDPVNGVIAAQMPHRFLDVDQEGKLAIIEAEGNRFAHVVLRGSFDTTNYDPQSICAVLEKLQQAEIGTKILVDCSHGNCQRDHERQKEAFYSVIRQIQEGNNRIAGVMLESHLEGGSQPLDFPLQYAVSITDPCIDWDTTEELILQLSR